jgi:Right handed beta helix region
MKRIIALTAVAALGLMALAAPAHAQATRTWVSGVGDDANPCSRTAPCKTFAGAISKTAPSGEINVLDPGGFGAVTITKAITISSESSEAGVLVSGTNGIIVQAGPNDDVILRGLDIEGLGTGINGVRFLSGHSLTIEKCLIHHFTSFGIDMEEGAVGLLFVDNTRINSNGNQGAHTGGGILVQPSASATSIVTITNTQVDQNASGITFNGAGGNILATVANSTIASNGTAGTGNGVTANTNATVTLAQDLILTNSGSGVNATGAGATVRIGGSTIAGNSTGVSGATLQSYKNNQIGGNTTDGTPITAFSPGPLN